MLVFTRNVVESFRIGNDVEILLADANGVVVKLGMEAPKHIRANRREVHERIFSGSIKGQGAYCASKLTAKFALYVLLRDKYVNVCNHSKSKG